MPTSRYSTNEWSEMLITRVHRHGHMHTYLCSQHDYGECAGYLMRRGSAFIKRQINPSNEPIEVSEATHHRIASVRAYSQKVSDTSEAVVSGALKTCRIVGNKIGSALTSGSGMYVCIHASMCV